MTRRPRTNSLVPLLILLTGLGVVGFAQETHDWIYKKAQLKIMCLGNSITQWQGWRLYLQDSLRANGYSYHYVGGNYAALGSEGYNSFHSGFWGAAINDLPNGGMFITGYADWKGLQPDLILMEIGTNDIQNSSTTAPQDLGRLLDNIWTDVPNAIILVSSIPPFVYTDVANNQRADAFNAQVPGVVSQKAALGKKVMFVDIHSSMTTDTSDFFYTNGTYDHVHPGDKGHRKMAAKWYEAVKNSTITTGDYPPAANLPPIVQATVTPTFATVPFTTPNTIATNPSFVKTVNTGETVHLYGRLVDAGAASATGVTYAWSLAHGPGTVTFTAPSSLNTDVTFSGAGQFGLCLTATRNGLTGKGYCRVIVNKTGGGDDYAPGAIGKAIGVNLTSTSGLAAGDQAGVVPRGNWNNFSCLSPSERHPLVQSDGTALSTTMYDQVVNGCGTYQLSSAPATPDGKLMGTGLWYRDGQRHRIWNIPYARYDLYLYFSYTESGNDAFNNSFLVREMLDDQWVAGPYFAGNIPNFNGTFARLPTNGVADGANAPKANYLVVPNLALKDVYIYLDVAWNSWPHGSNYVNLDGIQLVERTDVTGVRSRPGIARVGERSLLLDGPRRSIVVARPGVVTVTNAAGRRVMTVASRAQTSTIDISLLNDGVYVACLLSARHATAVRFVVGE